LISYIIAARLDYARFLRRNPAGTGSIFQRLSRLPPEAGFRESRESAGSSRPVRMISVDDDTIGLLHVVPTVCVWHTYINTAAAFVS
jgi:hypothetical protein